MSPNEAMVHQNLPRMPELNTSMENGKDICEAVDLSKLNDLEESKRINEEYQETINKPFLQRTDIKWKFLTQLVLLHAVALYGFLTFPYMSKKLTFLWGWFLVIVANFGVGGGIHRLWSHRAYKAKLPLRIILMLCYVTSGQYSAMHWIMDHRVHHKFSETDADPVNSARGFWFCHCGWLAIKTHPEVIRRVRQIDFSDCWSDPVIKYEEKYYFILRPLFAFILPTLVPVYFWNETWYYAILSQLFMRYAYSLNCTWCINSFAHMYGKRPYNKAIAPAENFLMSLMSGGEGWHNYHHVFPWDYKTAEFGSYVTNANITLFLIDFFAKIGWAYDLKQPSQELVKEVIKKRGDGTHPIVDVNHRAEKIK